MILEIANSAKFRDLSPCKIVPLLADEGRYLPSESTFYRVLKDAKQLTHRHKSQPKKHHKPEAFGYKTQSNLELGHNLFALTN